MRTKTIATLSSYIIVDAEQVDGPTLSRKGDTCILKSDQGTTTSDTLTDIIPEYIHHARLFAKDLLERTHEVFSRYPTARELVRASLLPEIPCKHPPLTWLEGIFGRGKCKCGCGSMREDNIGQTLARLTCARYLDDPYAPHIPLIDKAQTHVKNSFKILVACRHPKPSKNSYDAYTKNKHSTDYSYHYFEKAVHMALDSHIHAIEKMKEEK